jgi:hypothetical protein
VGGLTIGYWYNPQKEWAEATVGGVKGVLLGDANGDLKADNGENTLFVPHDAAIQLINSSQTANDARQILLSQALAAQLNINKGDRDPGYLNPGGNAAVTGKDLISEAVTWLTGPGNVEIGAHNNVLSAGVGSTFEYDTKKAAFTSAAVGSSSTAWQGQTPYASADYGNFSANGEGLKNALQAFNTNHLVTSPDSLYVAWSASGSTTGPFTDVSTNGANDFWRVLHLELGSGLLKGVL